MPPVSIEELFLDKSGALRSEDSAYALEAALNASISLPLWHCSMPPPGNVVQSLACAPLVDLIGGAALATSRWVCAGFTALSMLAATPAPDCVAPKRPTKKVLPRIALRDFYDQIWFTRIRSLTCKP